MTAKKYLLILASMSPRRKELLAWLDVPFLIKSMQIEERSDKSTPAEIVVDLAKQKGQAVYQNLSTHTIATNYNKIDKVPLIVAADTIVVIDQKILGRPDSIQAAREMLLALSGRTHQVFTGVYLGGFSLKNLQYKEICFFTESKVTFETISEDLLEKYLQTGDALDKAGAYGIQGPALTFISKLEGSYSNVVGFPLSDFVGKLKEFLGFTSDFSGNWRELFESA